MGTNIKSMLVRNSKFTAIIDEFTENTYIMVVVSDPKIRTKTQFYLWSLEPTAIELSVDGARRYVEKKYEQQNQLENPNWKP